MKKSIQEIRAEADSLQISRLYEHFSCPHRRLALSLVISPKVYILLRFSSMFPGRR